MVGNVFLIGHRGYLGSNLLKAQSLLNVKTKAIDTRDLDYKKHELNFQDIVLDCSRLRSFSGESLQEDSASFARMMDWVSRSNARYVRVGSVLEVEDSAEPTPYIEWSKARSQKIQEFENQRKFQILLVPNIYGGVGSTSIVDLLLQSHQGRELDLLCPDAYRDFLSMTNFLKFIRGFMVETKVAIPSVSIVTSGIKHQIASLQDFIVTRNSAGIKSKRAMYPTDYPQHVISESLQKYIQSHPH